MTDIANPTVSGGIEELANIAIAEARSNLLNMNDLRNTIMRRDLQPGQISVRFPSWNDLTAAALTEGNEAAAQESTTTGILLTPAVNAVTVCTITDLADFVSNRQTAVDFGKRAARAIQKKINADIWALFAGFSVGIGTSNVDITEALIATGVKKLRQQNVEGEIYLAITPEVAEDLMAIYSTNTNNTSDAIRTAVFAGQMPTIYGVKVVLVTSGISEATDLVCGLYSPEALGIAYAWDVKIEAQRRARAVGYDLVASAAYAVGEVVDLFGLKMTVDGAD